MKTVRPRVVMVAATAGVIVAVGLLVWAIAVIPPLQVHGVAVERTDTSAETATVINVYQRDALINEYRRTLVQAIGGVFIVIGALSGAYFTWRQITVTREGQCRTDLNS